MNVEIKDGKATFSLKEMLREMLREMSGDELLDLAQALSCEDYVIDAVMDQIINGSTENGSHGALSHKLMPRTSIEHARRRIAKDSHIVAKDEIERMERHMQWREELHRKVNNWAWNMYHSWPDESIRRRPDPPQLS